MFELLIQTSKLKGKRITLPLGKEIVIGREAGAQLMLGSNLISRRHCELKHVAEGIWVRDLDSQNGTYVNDVAIPAPTLLRAGDVLRVGTFLFEVQIAQPKTKPASKTAADGKLSDNEIAAWLTDSDAAIPTSTSDTAILPGGKPLPGSTVPAATQAPAPRKFKSVKEEAADIIRRHLEGAERT